MSSADQNLSSTATKENLLAADEFYVGIVVAKWNSEVTEKLLEGAISTLLRAGCKRENIIVKRVPGAFELPLAAQMMITNYPQLDGVITLGCVVRGGTPHFEYVSSGTTNGIMQVQLENYMPVAFGLLTVDTMEQAMDRAGGKYGNKGDEAAATLIDMITLSIEMSEDSEQNAEDFNLEYEMDEEQGADLMEFISSHGDKPRFS